MSDATNPIQRLYAVFLRVTNSLQSPFLLAIRLYWGFQISMNGWGKLHNLGHVTEFFQSLGLPAPGATAVFVSSFEFVGGILLAIGLLSRIAALGLFIDMTTAYLTADRDAVKSFFSDPNKFVAADPYVFWFFALIILIFGPGKFAVDTLVARSRDKNPSVA
ncbi:MAG TPA: DoxX family protein [Candidatus Acidoferrales bacterium]